MRLSAGTATVTGLLSSKSYASELPSQGGLEKVAVSRAAMPCGGRYGRASQHHLVHHKLTVIFSDGAFFFFEAGIWQIGTLRPFPSFSPLESSGCGLPFPLRGQSAPRPGGIGYGLIIADMTDGLVSVQGSQTGQRILVPSIFGQMPVQRGSDSMALHPIPALRMPVDKVLIPAVFDEGKILFIGDQGQKLSGNRSRYTLCRVSSLSKQKPSPSKPIS